MVSIYIKTQSVMCQALNFMVFYSETQDGSTNPSVWNHQISLTDSKQNKTKYVPCFLKNEKRHSTHLLRRRLLTIFCACSLLTLVKWPPRRIHSISAWVQGNRIPSTADMQNCLSATHPNSHNPTTSSIGSAL